VASLIADIFFGDHNYAMVVVIGVAGVPYIDKRRKAIAGEKVGGGSRQNKDEEQKALYAHPLLI
jgi:hypothetical protein